MTLGQKQRAFAKMVARLILKACELGYEVSLGEAWRRPGVGKKWSLHRKRLAIDLNLFKNGKYLTRTEAHRPLGEWWERLGKKHGLPLCWGGRFKKRDGNHYSLSYNGVR